MSLFKENFRHIIVAEIEETYGITIPAYTEKNKLIYPLSRPLPGIYHKKLYVYFLSGHVIEYKVHHFIFNIKVM
jgi:hypothetical protein